MTVDDLAADTEYRFRATYGGDDAHLTSDSNDAVVTTVAAPVDPQQEDKTVTVTIPADANGLHLTVSGGDVALGAPTLEGSTYTSTGWLGQVTVTDNRADRLAWTLSGEVTDFVHEGDASAKIAAGSLGWKPQRQGTGAGTAGAEVVAGQGGGLASAKPLAQAPAGATAATTTVDAGLTLKAPADSTPGAYTATLTLTLI